jgi:hypothetical protein
MSDPLCELDDYDRRHLTSHLVAARRADDLHRLLALEVTGVGSRPANAWYHAKVEGDDAAAFNADVETAWALADAAFTTGTPQERGDALALQCRYALITASLNSLTENLPPNLLASLMDHGLRTSRSVLSIIETTPDPHRRALSLRRLAAPLTHAGLEHEVIAVAVEINDEADRAEGLEGVAGSVPAAALRSMLPAVRALVDEANRARVLAAFGARADMPGPVLAAVVDEAMRLNSEDLAALVLTRIGPHLDAELAERAAVRVMTMRSAAAAARAAAVVAPQLKDGGQQLLDTALSKARAGRSRTQRVHALAALGRHSEAVTEAEQIPDTQARVESLAALAEYLTPAQLESVLEGLRTLGGARRAARWKATALAALAPHVLNREWRALFRNVVDIQYRDERARALAAIAPHIPRALAPRLVRSALEFPRAAQSAAVLRAAGTRLGEPELAAVLAKVKRMRRHGDRGMLLAAVAAHLSEAQADEALTFVRRIRSMSDRALAIDALAQRLSGPSLEEAIASLGIADDKETEATFAALAPWLPDTYRSGLEAQTLEGEAWSDHAGGISEPLTPDIPGETPGTSVGERSSSIAGAEHPPVKASERAHARADALARLSAAAPLIAEARAAGTTALSTSHIERRKEEPPPILYWLRAAEVLIPDSSAIRMALQSPFGRDSWWWGHDAAESLRGLIELLVELEQFADAVAAASAIAHPLSRADALASLAPALPSAARSDAISQALSSVKAGLEGRNVYLRQGFGSPFIELVGVSELALQQHLLTPVQREQLASLIFSEQLIEPSGNPGLIDSLRAALCWALAELVPDLEDAATAEAWALQTTSMIRDEKLRADTLARLEPVIGQARLDDWSSAATAIRRPASHGELRVVLARRLVKEGRAGDALTALTEACAAAQVVADRDDRGRVLAAIAKFARDYGESALTVLWGTRTDQRGPGLLRHLANRGRRNLLSDLAHLAPALAAIDDDVVVQTFRAIRDVRRWWP